MHLRRLLMLPLELASVGRALSTTGSAAAAKKKTIVLVRHGAVDYASAGLRAKALYGGDIDVPLSARGRAEARAAAAFVRDTYPAVDAVFASTLSRAIYGAERIAAEYDNVGTTKVRQVEAFREIRRGDWLRRRPEELPPGAMDTFLTDQSWRVPGGESVDDVRARALEALIDDVLPAVRPGCVAVLVTHLYVTRALLSLALPVDSKMADIDVPTASISAVAVDDGGFIELLSQGFKPTLLPDDETQLAAAAKVALESAAET